MMGSKVIHIGMVGVNGLSGIGFLTRCTRAFVWEYRLMVLPLVQSVEFG